MSRFADYLYYNGIQQTNLAEAAGVSQAFISGVVKGVKLPSLAAAKRMAEYLGISIDLLSELLEVR